MQLIIVLYYMYNFKPITCLEGWIAIPNARHNPKPIRSNAIANRSWSISSSKFVNKI